MIIDPKKTTLAYRCPACGSVPTSMVGAFSLSGDLFKLKCGCGESFMTLEKTRDSKIRLTVPCILCPHPHSFYLSNEVFFGSESFMIPCSTCGIDICFIGKEDKVKEAIKISNEEIIKAVGDHSIDALKSGDENTMPDPQVVEIVTYVIRELHEEGNIHCNCSEGEGDYECKVHSDFITVKCNICGASCVVDASSTIKAHDFLNTDKLILK